MLVIWGWISPRANRGHVLSGDGHLGRPDRQLTHRRGHRAATRAYLYSRHYLRLFIRTLPETVAGARGQRQRERQDSDNTHDVISFLTSV